MEPQWNSLRPDGMDFVFHWARIPRGRHSTGPGKLKKYYEKTSDGKQIVRKVMQRYIPEQITNGIKQGFSAPDASWFKEESIDYVKKKLYNDNAQVYDYLDRQAVQKLVNEHIDGKQNRRLLVWSLLSFEWWLRKYLH